MYEHICWDVWERMVLSLKAVQAVLSKNSNDTELIRGIIMNSFL